MKALVLPAVVWLILALGILLVAGNQLIGMANIRATLFGAEVYGGCEVKTGLKLVPLIGYYSCEPQGYDLIDTMAIPDGSWWNPGIDWSTCCSYNAKSCDYKILKEDRSKELSSMSAMRGECITVKKDSVFSGQRVIDVYGDPFALWVYSPISSPEKVNSENCRLPSTSNLLKKIVSYVGTGSLSTIINPTDSLDFNQKSSFLADWAVSPSEYNYKDGKWCASGGYIYATQTVELMSGCYAVPNLNAVSEKEIGCLGEPCSVGGKAGIVDESYNCILKEGSQCSILNPCPGQGRYNVDWNKDSTGKTSVVYGCVNGYCEPTYKVSACASNSACPVGQSCQFSASSGIGTCVSLGTTPIPPQPPILPGGGFDWGIFKRIFTAMFVSGIILFGVLVVGMFFPPLRLISGFIRSPKMFLIVWIGLSVVLMMVFAVPMGNIAASIFGGI